MAAKEHDILPAYERDPDNYFPTACRLCGQTWSFPRVYEQSFKEDPSWECPYCRRMWNMYKRGEL